MIWSSPPLRARTCPTPPLPRLHGARLTPPRTFMGEAPANAVACYPRDRSAVGAVLIILRNTNVLSAGKIPNPEVRSDRCRLLRGGRRPAWAAQRNRLVKV